MSKIIVFNDIQQAVTILKKYPYVYFKEKYDLPGQLQKDEIIKRSVGSNIFRAFHNLKHTPSSIYRAWAHKNFTSILEALNNCKSQNEYDRYILKWTNSFITYWNITVTNNQQRIPYGPAIKITNLLVKVISENKVLTNQQILRFMHIPFDEFTLKPIRIIINELTDINFRVDVPKNPTMKLITNYELYNIFRKSLFDLCDRARIYPICYDYWCWNERH